MGGPPLRITLRIEGSGLDDDERASALGSVRTQLTDHDLVVRSLAGDAPAAPGAKGAQEWTTLAVEISMAGALHVAVKASWERLRDRFGDRANLIVDGPGGTLDLSKVPASELAARIAEVAEAD